MTGGLLSSYDAKGKVLTQLQLAGGAVRDDPAHDNAFVVQSGKASVTLQVR
jgi:hypothetical protein